MAKKIQATIEFRLEEKDGKLHVIDSDRCCLAIVEHEKAAMEAIDETMADAGFYNVIIAEID